MFLRKSARNLTGFCKFIPLITDETDQVYKGSIKYCLFIFTILLIGLVGCSQNAPQQFAPIVVQPAPSPNSNLLLATPTLVPAIGPVASTVTAVSSPTIPSLSPTPIPFPIYNGAPLDAGLIGVQIHLREEDQDGLFDHLNALGVGWVKVQLSWKLYEPAPGEYHAERFAELDAFIDRANDEQIQLLLGLSKAPEWSRPTPELDGPPSDFALFETFTWFVANRYRGQVSAYELWNEPNLQREWNGRTLNAADFVSLMQFGAKGIRQSDPAAMIISGAPATTGINDGVTAVDDRLFLQQMVAAGVGEIVDGFGAHPYGAANPPDSNFVNPSSATSSHNNHPSFFFSDTIIDYEAILAQANVLKPIWVTEFGWGSFENIAPVIPTGAEFMAQTNEWQQAEYIARAFEIAQSNASIGPMMLWNLNFAPLLGENFSESGYSILAKNGTPRPSYFTLQQALALAP